MSRGLLRLVWGRWFGVVAVTFGVMACSSGPELAKPKDLSPNPGIFAIRTAWTSSIGEVKFGLVPSVYGSQLALASSNGVVAVVDATVGSEVWRADLGQSIAAGVGFDGRFAAVVTGQQELVVLENAQVRWRAPLSAGALTPPLVAGQRVFALTTNRTLSAWDAATGKQLWQQARGADALVLSQPGLLTAVQDTLVVGGPGKLAGVNPNTGALRWEVSVATSRGANEVEKLVDIVAGHARAGNTLCVRAYQAAISCVDASGGVRLWSRPTAGFAGIHGDGSVLAAADTHGVITAYQHDTGDVLWVSKELQHRRLGAVQVVGRSVVVSDAQGMLHFFSKKDGALLARVTSDGSPLTFAPLLVEKTLVAVTQKGQVLGFRPE